MNKAMILKGFQEAMLWASNDERDNEHENLDETCTIEDITVDANKKIMIIIDDFLKNSKLTLDMIKADEDQVGHDLFLTAKGFSVGFWDRPHYYPNGLHLTLSAWCDDYRYNIEPYINAENKVELN